MKKIFFIIFFLLITNANSLERSKEEIKNGIFLEDITALGNINDKDIYDEVEKWKSLIN